MECLLPQKAQLCCRMVPFSLQIGEAVARHVSTHSLAALLHSE